jgi:hypothetical protein
MQNQENQENQEVEISEENSETSPPISEENSENSPATTTEEEAPPLRSDEVVDVEWKQVEQLYKVNVFSQQLENELAGLCLQYEKNKQKLLSRITECETFLYSQGTALRDSQGIDPSLTYELKLPSQEGEKAFFVRKDA